MRWGFGWELGPFEMMDTLGLAEFAGRVKKEGRELPALIERVLASGRKSFYQSEKGTTTVFDLGPAGVKKVEETAGNIILKALEEPGRKADRNSAPSRIGLGVGRACCDYPANMKALCADLSA